MKQKLFLLLLWAFCALSINAEVVTGFCGPSVKFNLDTTTGVLKIEGSGNMNDYRWSYREPDWFYYREHIKTIEISNTVTSIGNSAFHDLSALTSVTIPNSIGFIGEYAFLGCDNLKELVLGEGLRSIGDNAFLNTSIESIYSCSPIPPSCDGSAFSSDTYELAMLYVPNEQAAIQQYKAHKVWSWFSNIKEYDFTGITATPSFNAAPPSIYDLSGKKLNTQTKGLNVVGNKKVLVR